MTDIDTPPRIILLGATGYTGDLTARSLIAQGARPMLVARNLDRVRALAAERGGLDPAVADVNAPDTIRAVLRKGDVLISTVGPFLRYGRPAVRSAAEAGAHYIDSSGEGPFIREVFEHWGNVAERNHATLLPAFGFDFVPGALAAALALDEAGPDATAVDIAYFSSGFVPSGGTQASALRVLFEDNFAFRDGHVRGERVGRFVKRFEVEGTSRTAASIPAAEHLGLPQSYPRLRDITVMLGLGDQEVRIMSTAAHIASALSRVKPIAREMASLTDRFSKGSTGGPDEAERAKARATVVAVAGRTIGSPAELDPLATVTLTGPNPYDITADLLAWAAIAAAGGELRRTGAAGPISAFGTDAVRAGCELAGISDSDPAF